VLQCRYDLTADYADALLCKERRGSTESRPTKRVLAKISLVGRRSAEPQQVQHFVKYLRSSQDYRAGSAANGGADWVGAGTEVLVRRSLNHMITT